MAQKINLPHMKITFRNLAGRPTDWNKKGGKRDFAIVLEDMADVEQLRSMGFAVKQFNKKNPEDPDSFYIKVKANFRFDDEGKLLSPHIYVINGKSKVLMQPSNVEIVDRADIDYCDITITPYYAEVNGNNYVSAYLDRMYVNIVEDEFEKKYSIYDEDEELDNESEEIPFE